MTAASLAHKTRPGTTPAQTGSGRNGMTNMEQRMAEIGGVCQVSSQSGGGCLVMFAVPLPPERRRWFRPKTGVATDATPADFSQPRL